ncbi:hypothetical protein GCM10027258_93470 [Amycolatopsis stemonae]
MGGVDPGGRRRGSHAIHGRREIERTTVVDGGARESVVLSADAYGCMRLLSTKPSR